MTNTKKTLAQLEKEYYWYDLGSLWDDLCNTLPMYYNEEDICEEFAKKYNVDLQEVRDYFIG